MTNQQQLTPANATPQESSLTSANPNSTLHPELAHMLFEHRESQVQLANTTSPVIVAAEAFLLGVLATLLGPQSKLAGVEKVVLLLSLIFMVLSLCFSLLVILPTLRGSRRANAPASSARVSGSSAKPSGAGRAPSIQQRLTERAWGLGEKWYFCFPTTPLSYAEIATRDYKLEGFTGWFKGQKDHDHMDSILKELELTSKIAYRKFRCLRISISLLAVSLLLWTTGIVWIIAVH